MSVLIVPVSYNNWSKNLFKKLNSRESGRISEEWIFEHAVKSVLESEERFVNVSMSLVPVLECGFHSVIEARVSLGDRARMA